LGQKKTKKNCAPMQPLWRWGGATTAACVQISILTVPFNQKRS